MPIVKLRHLLKLSRHCLTEWKRLLLHKSTPRIVHIPPMSSGIATLLHIHSKLLSEAEKSCLKMRKTPFCDLMTPMAIHRLHVVYLYKNVSTGRLQQVVVTYDSQKIRAVP